MKIIISPAKTINENSDFRYISTKPLYLDKAINLYEILRSLSLDELKATYKASETISLKAYNDLRRYDINSGFISALFGYDGIQYKSLAPSILDDESLDYLNRHLRILSGLYGILAPFDQIVPYRLEMGQSLKDIDLYDYWKDLGSYFNDEDYLINLASNEYSKAIKTKAKVINVYFYNGNKIKGVYAKKARGALLRYMAINKIENPKAIENFKELNYHIDIKTSDAYNYVFRGD